MQPARNSGARAVRPGPGGVGHAPGGSRPSVAPFGRALRETARMTPLEVAAPMAAVADPGPAREPGPGGRPRAGVRWKMAALLTAIMVLSYIDRQAFPSIVKAIEREIPISDQQFS